MVTVPEDLPDIGLYRNRVGKHLQALRHEQGSHRWDTPQDTCLLLVAGLSHGRELGVAFLQHPFEPVYHGKELDAVALLHCTGACRCQSAFG